MVGIVIVSHSHRIAEGVAELAREMGGPEVKLETAGGLDALDDPAAPPPPGGPEHPIGTDAVRVMQAIERAWSDDGVLVLMDLGSAVLSAEMALDLLGDGRRERVLLCEAPLVEGAVAAAVTAKLGMPLEAVAAEAVSGLASKSAHLGVHPDAVTSAADVVEGTTDVTAAVVITVDIPHGLHARPAARFVQTAAGCDASITVRNLTTGAGPADGASLNGVATLGVRSGHEIEIRASGPAAADAIAALEALGARRFDEPTAERERPSSDGPWSPTTTKLPTPERIGAGRLVGTGASPGIAVGGLRRFHTPPLDVPEERASDVEAELARLELALRDTSEAIAGQRADVAERAGEDDARIFDAHRLFLLDEALLRPARTAIRDHRVTGARAWHDAVDDVATTWDTLDDPYMRARAVDLRSVGTQVLARILGAAIPASRFDEPGILVTADLAPAEAAGLDPEMCLGIVTAHGGPTSHAAVLARALGIPAVVGVGESVLTLPEGRTLLVDGTHGEVRVDPPADVLARFESARRTRAFELARVLERAAEPAVTVDGTTIEVSANIGGPDEVTDAVAAGADGIGLFRTELLFMHRESLPDEQEQETVYRVSAAALAGRPLLIRTLDAGADKPVAALEREPEVNPFLGVRGIRLGLERPDLLLVQLQALLRVAADHPLRVMFPMVATVEELTEARALLERARATTGVDAAMEVGIMVEVPAAALSAAALSAHADFFSIGTNDLTQYTFAADRGNEHVAELNDSLHPAVLRLIAATVDGARTHDRWVGICGELAGDELATPLLLGLGVLELSMAAPAIASVKDAVRSTSLGDARALAARALGCATAAEVRDLLGHP